jgi:phage-related protein
MPQIEVILYCEDDGTAPLDDWLDTLQVKARDRCLALLTLLRQKGNELRRPYVENVGEGLYELRVKFFRVNYRMLYFFHGRDAAVVSHGFSKEQKIPRREIDLALERKRKFEGEPRRHTFSPEA